MSIATEKVKQVSERFTLVRISGAKRVNSSASLTSISMADPVYDVKEDGVSLTQVFTTPANGEWWYEDDTKTLHVDGASSTTRVIYYYLFYTTTQDRRFNQDPSDSNSTVRNWKGRLSKDIVIKRSLSNQLSGFATASSQTVKILDDDKELRSSSNFNGLVESGGFAASVSFFNKPIDVWIVINGQVKKIGRGTITNVSVGVEDVTFGFIDLLRLNIAPYMGDTSAEAFEEGEPLPFVFGQSALGVTNAPTKITTAGAGGVEILDYTKCHTGILTNPAGPTYPYSLCRTVSGLKTLSFGTLVAAEIRATASQKYVYHSTDRTMLSLRITTGTHNLEVGDSFKFTDPSFVGDQYAVVTLVSTFSGDALLFCIVLTQDTTAFSDITGTITLFTNSSPAVLLYSTSGSSPYLLCSGLDFTSSETTTSFGNKVQKITTVSGFEFATRASLVGGTIHPGLVALDPASDLLVFRATTLAITPSATFEYLLESNTGATLASTVAFGGNTSMSIPHFQESGYQTLDSYLSEMIEYFNALLYKDDVGDFHLIDFTSSASAVLDLNNKNIIEGSLSTSVEYRDMLSELELDNPNNDAGDFSNGPNNNAFLHEMYSTSSIVSSTVFNPSLANNATLLSVRSNPVISVQGRGTMELIELELGDNIRIQSDLLLTGVNFGSGSNGVLKVVSLEVGVEEIGFEALFVLQGEIP